MENKSIPELLKQYKELLDSGVITAEEFEQDVKEISVNLYLPDSRACTVMFEKTPEGELEITGWAYTDEAE